MRDLALTDMERLGAFDEAERTFLMTEEAFRVFYELTARPVRVYLARMTGDDRLADDLLQETYYRFLRSNAAFESDDHRRHYLFRILNRRSPPALDKGKVWWLPLDLDSDAMHEAAQCLAGKHDFSTFRAAQCQANSPVKTLDRIDVVRYGELIEMRCDARSFLHNQVRSMAGSLKLVGEGKWRARDLKAALDAADRSRCGPVSPPNGLYLLKVDY